ncbi:MAG: hypothetical protein BGP13_04335 [Sphingobacteriales bacterium 40-81]|nr:MAG: hypothetical protein BGP13_04335 [Sphingobacteriales bacterium 40-81]
MHTTPVRSQSVIPGAEIMEVAQLAETYRSAADLSFNVQIRYTDSVTVDSIVEQTTAIYKLHGGLFYTYIDSNEIIQGNKYCIKVSHPDSVITIRNRQDYPDVLNMPVADTLYWSTFAESISVTAVSDSVRSIKIKFRPGAEYSSYEIKYNFIEYRIIEIKCYRPVSVAGGEDAELFPSGKALLKFTFSGYSTAPLAGTWFSEDKYIFLQAGQFTARPPYTGYFIENNIIQQ